MPNYGMPNGAILNGTTSNGKRNMFFKVINISGEWTILGSGILGNGILGNGIEPQISVNITKFSNEKFVCTVSLHCLHYENGYFKRIQRTQLDQ